MIFSADLMVRWSLFMSFFVAAPNQTVMEEQRMDSMTDAVQKMAISSCGRPCFFSCFRKQILCWAFLIMALMLCSHFRSLEMMTPMYLNESTLDTRLFAIVRGGRCWGVFPEVHHHLHSLQSVKLQVVLAAPGYQPLNLQSVSSLITVLDKTNDSGVVSKLQELDSRVT